MSSPGQKWKLIFNFSLTWKKHYPGLKGCFIWSFQWKSKLILHQQYIYTLSNQLATNIASRDIVCFEFTTRHVLSSKLDRFEQRRKLLILIIMFSSWTLENDAVLCKHRHCSEGKFSELEIIWQSRRICEFSLTIFLSFIVWKTRVLLKSLTKLFKGSVSLRSFEILPRPYTQFMFSQTFNEW